MTNPKSGSHERKQLYILLCDTDYYDLICSPASKGLLLIPTGQRRGQYRRDGWLRLIGEPETVLALTKHEDLPDGHLGFDTDKGHIIEIV